MRSIRIYDERFEQQRFVGEHKNIPSEWSSDEIMKRYGIGEHLTVYEQRDDKSRKIQPYEEWKTI